MTINSIITIALILMTLGMGFTLYNISNEYVEQRQEVIDLYDYR